MMKDRFTWLTALILFSIMISSAQGATPIEDVLQKFTACNGEFFYSIKENKESISKIAPLTENTKSASFAVENRVVKGKDTSKFSSSIDVFGLHLLGYFDEVSSITPKEQYYYWGFLVAESPDEVRTRLESRIKNHKLLKNDGGAFVRLEMHDGKNWVTIESPKQFAGKIPGSYVERVLIIEKSSDKEFHGTRLTCSIQGPVTDIIIADARPDLPSGDYPIRPKFSGMDFDSVPVEPKVQQEVDKLLKIDRLKPKFKTVSLKYKVSRKGSHDSKDDYFVIETYQAMPNGLLKKREIYSSTFFVDRLLLWNLIQLKSKMSTSELYLTREINVKPPESLSPGATLETEVVSGDEFKPSILKKMCTFGDEYPANEINGLLTGTARKINCINPIDGTNDEFSFLDDLGLAIRRSYIDKKKSESVYELIYFNSNILEENRLVRLASKTNESLPKMVDQYTRLDSTAGTIDTFHFNYTLVNHTGAEGKKAKQALEDAVIKNMCTSKDMLDLFINKKVTVSFSYYGNDRVKITEFSVPPSQCLYWQQL